MAERQGRYATSSQVVLAVLAVIGALYLMRIILVPIALALVLACMFAPVASFFRRWFPFGSLGALALVLLLIAGGLYVASLTAESLIRGTQTIPAEVERLAGQVSKRINEVVRAQPYLRGVLPDPGTIDRLGDTNSAILIEKMTYSFADLSFWAVEGFIVLVLVIFLLVEGPMLTHKVIRFASRTTGEADRTSLMLGQVTRKIRVYLVARTIINLGLGLVIAGGLWLLNIHYALALGLFAGVTNFVPYIGQLLGGALPTVVAIGQNGSIGDALLVAAMYLAAVGVEGYVVTPMVLGRSLDLNGTTVLVACLFWGFLWGLIGLVLAMPITVSLKLFFQSVPELNRWAELMSVDWQSPDPDDGDPALAATLVETLHGPPIAPAGVAARAVAKGKEQAGAATGEPRG
ncbi:AI-2 transport protein TqsA [Aquisphaera giovannonii]|uniref:AI-2 transport protein TqsA n=1 Tax=Aquisphaera giovannonii TaxID=406548 RepID=A0A5B9WDP2_9BACT|nr:AI-2E family transporter [Aquisphaera giovannonii]QEH38349.1 AI-2 transport protein TqsA [Aquisphaera giovannonii]